MSISQVTNRKRSRIKHPAFLGGLLLLMVASGFILWKQSLNRQLIDALVCNDAKRAISLVNAGADPRTRYSPMPGMVFQDIIDHFRYGTPLPRTYHHAGDISTNAIADINNPMAIEMACGASWTVDGRDAQTYGRALENDGFREARFELKSPELVEAMLQHGASANTGSGDDNSLLGYTLRYGESNRIAEILLKHGADPNVCVNGRELLLSWVSPSMVRLLIAHGANVNARGYSGKTSLYSIIEKEGIIRPPWKEGLSDDTKDIMGQLMAHGADPNQPIDNGDTPLNMAKRNHRDDLIALMKPPK